ncbi:MAG: alanyl-tRNA editing protein [Chloroflexi bacterium]|nr:MAG: hypothetical protein B6I35_00975 [Anaerolineaceae bacterium 4572_32.2]RLC77415.1 MAG: alanyl-tRNA editing protein [Chloroflexota bacterium]RLC85365.1 MAG: alanyl-tRNA editing protein [Chloroflexota bacterium]HEY72208.1 alanyl-tRNA editing protein [Thermoflexia bacterium]
MTERLYYTDSYCTHFSARVIEQLTWEGRPAVVLDRTAFYPTSGGQPADQGMLGGLDVLDVIVREEDDAIVHVLSGDDPLDFPKPDGSEIEGVLDWPRRFDHMQQHTGQHILSAAFEQLLDADTVGFHLGAEASTVDIDVPQLDPAAVEPVEKLANHVIWENRQVSVCFVGQDKAATLPLRRPPAVEGLVRIVEIADFDVNPCGGTHVARTGEIGLIKIVRLDHRGDETRVEFLCGDRAWRDYRDRSAMTNRLSVRLTVGYWELDRAVERLQEDAKQLRQDLRRVRKRLLEADAAELVETAVTRGPYRVVCRVLEQSSSFSEELPGELRRLAQALTQHPGTVALLTGVDERTHLCFACAEGLDLDAASLLREACARLGGKGGGRSHLAQGSAPPTAPAHIKVVLSDLASNIESNDKG